MRSDQANKEVSNRFDFKGSETTIESKRIRADRLRRRRLQARPGARRAGTAKLAKRGVDVRLLDLGTPEKVSATSCKQSVTVRNGIESTLAKKIVGLIKDSKLKVTAASRATRCASAGAKRDTLQEVDRAAPLAGDGSAADVRELSRVSSARSDGARRHHRRCEYSHRLRASAIRPLARSIAVPPCCARLRSHRFRNVLATRPNVGVDLSSKWTGFTANSRYENDTVPVQCLRGFRRPAARRRHGSRAGRLSKRCTGRPWANATIRPSFAP